jgi:eukaryotic-like serine/threonine-protein kinase
MKGERDVFDGAVALAPGERAAYLDDACAGDLDVRRRMEALLAAHDQARGILEAAPPGLTVAADDPAPPFVEPVGSMLGPYKLLELIGEGGMGAVYMAEQQRPVRRVVALKLIKPGMDTRQAIARFEAERQALAMMEHPNIARVLDAGSTEAGRLYFVMELVKGVPITDYCDQNHVAPRQRLELFVQVCYAVQHAHQKGVIHRDLKPTNVLVTLHDGVPVPKIIDFGIAKATQGRLTDLTLLTNFSQMVGTPLYMSPEQAELSGLDVDTRSDVYSLGVLLYELLTGTTPFEKKRLREAAYDEMRRIIREEEPPMPSTRISTLGGMLTAISAHRHTAPKKLGPLMRGELDWIVMKSLEKDRARRYATANGLAADVARYLNDEPVVALPPTAVYRFRKLVLRNRIVFAAAGAIGVALVVGLGLSMWMFLKEKDARQRAVAAEAAQVVLRRRAEEGEQKAKTAAFKSEQVARLLKDMLKGVAPSVAQGRDTKLLREILDKTAERIGNDLKDEPAVEVEIRSTLGTVYLALGEYRQSELMYRLSLEAAGRLPDIDQAIVADTKSHLATALRRLRPLGKGAEAVDKEAEAVELEALALRTKLFGPDHPAVAGSLNHLALIIGDLRRFSESESMAREALRINRKCLGDDNAEVGLSLSRLAAALQNQQRYPEAEQTFLQAIAIQRKANGEYPGELAWTIHNLAGLFEEQGKLVEAEASYREAVTIGSQMLGAAHNDVVFSFRMALAKVLERQGRWVDAVATIREQLAIIENTLGHRNRAAEILLVQLGSMLHAHGQLGEAEAVWREELTLEIALSGKDEAPVADSLISLAALLHDRGKFSEAEARFREGLAIRETKTPDDFRTFRARSMLGWNLLRQKKYSEAEPLLLSGYEGMKRRRADVGAEGDADVTKAVRWVIRLYDDTGTPDKAAKWEDELVEMNEAQSTVAAPTTPNPPPASVR